MLAETFCNCRDRAFMGRFLHQILLHPIPIQQISPTMSVCCFIKSVFAVLQNPIPKQSPLLPYLAQHPFCSCAITENCQVEQK